MSDNSEKYIARLRYEVEEVLSWGAVSGWHSKMFDELSEKVFESTRVMLSVATLKRFFGVVNHDGAPSITTLDALSQFVGKENWRAFKMADPIKRKKEKPPRKSIYVTIGFILAIISISLVGNKRPEVVINASEFSFSSKVLSKEYPNSVVFDFKIPSDLRSDSLHIQQYWDPTKTIAVQKDQTQATGIYYFPGYFRAKLMVDGKEAQAHDLFLKSEGWLGLIEYAPTPKYFVPEIDGTALSFPEEIKKEIIAREKPVVSSFHFIDDLGRVSGDNFSFSATVKNVFDDRWAVCQAMSIYFIGSTGAMIIPFSKIGCSSDNNLMLNDTYLRGKEHDLSPLSADFTDPVELSIQVEKKQVSILIGGKEVYTEAYKESMGKLVGARIKFKGLGEVLDFKLKDQNGELVLLQ
ncbi:hypothetical protein [Ekhidna sp.]|uniref:hypothetical protein n=1 Tax=Ekhidna sp. TaxID=2608089 RepID=UPI0032F0188E